MEAAIEQDVRMVAFGEKIAARMAERGIDLKAFAKTMSIGERGLRYWLNGRSQPPYDKLVKLCTELGFTPHQLLDWPDENSDILSVWSALDTAERQRLLEVARVMFDKSKGKKSTGNPVPFLPARSSPSRPNVKKLAKSR